MTFYDINAEIEDSFRTDGGEGRRTDRHWSWRTCLDVIAMYYTKVTHCARATSLERYTHQPKRKTSTWTEMGLDNK